MRRNRQRQCVIVASVLMMFFSSGLSRAEDPGTVLRNRLVLPELIQEVLARNPELMAARKQWEAVTNRITPARSLDDPILSLQLWNFPQNFNVMQTQNNIFGLSQNLPFPGKLALKGPAVIEAGAPNNLDGAVLSRDAARQPDFTVTAGTNASQQLVIGNHRQVGHDVTVVAFSAAESPA